MATKKAKPQQPDPIDLAAAAIAARVVCQLANEIAAALRRLQLQPAHLSVRHDRTAAERQRRHRAGKARAIDSASQKRKES
jgi:hypothetical protein